MWRRQILIQKWVKLYVAISVSFCFIYITLLFAVTPIFILSMHKKCITWQVYRSWWCWVVGSMFYRGYTKKSTQSSILVFSFIAEMAVTNLLKTENTRQLPLDLTHCKIPMNGGILTTNLSQANIWPQQCLLWPPQLIWVIEESICLVYLTYGDLSSGYGVNLSDWMVSF